jgi:hypothetical protein
MTKYRVKLIAGRLPASIGGRVAGCYVPGEIVSGIFTTRRAACGRAAALAELATTTEAAGRCHVESLCDDILWAGWHSTAGYEYLPALGRAAEVNPCWV